LIAGRGKIVAVEVKSSDRVNTADGRNLKSFINERKKNSSVSPIIYHGREVLEIRKNIWAVPDWIIFGVIQI
jgi:predicted AAA+ superfamily ATPase